MPDPFEDSTKPVSTWRHRVSLMLLLLGLGALLIGGGIYARRDHGERTSAHRRTETSEQTEANDSRARSLLQTWLIFSTVILIVFMAGSYAILRIGRRYRIQLVRKSPDATPTPDIWRMHRPPDEAEWSDPGESSN